tara:strand:- start:373 stop:531 length:159 start_codon:yes stop_codon:yes gene_type:complete
MNRRVRYDEGLDSDEIASYENKHDITPNNVMRDREETITAPDGKEYPIRDND